MIEKQAIFFLIIAITLSSACRPMKADPVVQSTKPEQPVAMSSDKLTQGSSPTVAEEVISPSIDAGDPIKPQLVETPPITPETKLYYNYPTKADYDAGVFPSYVDPKCVTYLQETNYPIKVIDPCYFLGNTVVLAKFMKSDSERKYIDDCVNNRIQRYRNHNEFTIEVLHVFKGNLKQKQINIKIFGMDSAVWGKKDEIAILGLYKDKYGNYISTGKALFLNLNRSAIRIHRGISKSEVKYSCKIADLPSTISELQQLFSDPGKKKFSCNKEEDRERLNFFLNTIKRDDWNKKCLTDTESSFEESEEEKEINNISGKRVPCSTCPEGYEIEDLSTDEYMDEVHKIKQKHKDSL